ncbi:Na/Pi cotransporter [Fervidicella metallireducens AeB]|uniref:Na/Pi cotransporter n=1 Tax=Fervidicella metallireducens AeB TaxID=1403537 RepID=A0A017RRZ2_9CLOT|nr:Na/Pi cotransporter family protein [Fervidicella metallireducens]EYE87366.1 Na/Pi cotransporter [Fervidicella metallireducens AeB]
MNYKMIFELLGGLGLFVYGMKLMGDGLQKAAGEKLKQILEVLTSNVIVGILVGTGVTAIIQSSSATTVMTVGFVNAGLMTLKQAAGVIMGANIGTTITAQLIAFKLTDIAPFILAVGAALVLFTKRKRSHDIGEIILGFGVLFVGMSMMEHSMKPLRTMPEFINLIDTLGRHKFLGILVGLGMTATVQSSSATIGILIALASGGTITLEVALPILFGDNIGTCATALLASIGTNKNAKRAALIHLIFNTIGTIIFMLAFPWILPLIKSLGGSISRQIANAHTMFNVANTIIQAPFVGLLVAFVNKLVPGEDKKENLMVLEYIDERLIETPSIAVGQVVKEVVRMGKLASKNVNTSLKAFLYGNEDDIRSIYEIEEVINFLEREITGFMVSLYNTSLSESQSEIITSLFHVVNDIERIGDHAENLVELAQYKIENSLSFSEQAITEVKYMFEKVQSAVDNAIDALENFDFKAAQSVIDIESKIDKLEKQLRKDHIDRLNKGICFPASGAIFLDIISNLERVGDHSNNIAEIVLEFNND